jgi:hypothetical protein
MVVNGYVCCCECWISCAFVGESQEAGRNKTSETFEKNGDFGQD